uniref:Ovule protein n=1 Tax=Caenorhabditis tropicalis TaxID=1561998 RepID=A0A1I7V066_9PELO
MVLQTGVVENVNTQKSSILFGSYQKLTKCTLERREKQKQLNEWHLQSTGKLLIFRMNSSMMEVFESREQRSSWRELR